MGLSCRTPETDTILASALPTTQRRPPETDQALLQTVLILASASKYLIGQGIKCTRLGILFSLVYNKTFISYVLSSSDLSTLGCIPLGDGAVLAGSK